MGFFKDRSDYFKSLANRNKAVAHGRDLGDGEVRRSFHRMNDENELQDAYVKWAHFPCVVHAGMSGRYTGRTVKADPKRKHTNVLLFLKKVKSAASMDDREDAYDECFTIMEDFIASIYNEFLMEGRCSNFSNIDLARFSFNTYEVSGTMFGWVLTFDDDVAATTATDYDSSKWFE